MLSHFSLRPSQYIGLSNSVLAKLPKLFCSLTLYPCHLLTRLASLYSPSQEDRLKLGEGRVGYAMP